MVEMTMAGCTRQEMMIRSGKRVLVARAPVALVATVYTVETRVLVVWV